VKRVKDDVTRSDQEVVTHQKKQTLRGAATHIIVGKALDKNESDPEIDKFNENAAAKRQELIRRLDKKLEDNGFTNNGGGNWSVPSRLQRLWDQLQNERLEMQRKFDDIVSKELEKKRSERGFYTHAWSKIAAQVDQTLAAKGLTGGSKPFSNIVALKST